MHGSKTLKILEVIWHQLNTFLCLIISVSGYRECQTSMLAIPYFGKP
jgi:hypothetical protein